MNDPNRKTRREFVVGAAAATAAASLATVVPAEAVARRANLAKSELISLGIIGIGPRGTYDLKAMLKFSDIRCVAIADVQAKRREASKMLVDEH